MMKGSIVYTREGGWIWRLGREGGSGFKSQRDAALAYVAFRMKKEPNVAELLRDKADDDRIRILGVEVGDGR